MIYKKLPVTVMIMTENEEGNIRQCLTSVVNYFDQVIVVDSFSQDRTLDICREFGIDIFQNRFIGWAEQRNWMLKNCPIRNEIIFFLDADEYIDEYFVSELKVLLKAEMEYAAIYVRVKYIFLSKHLKRSYGHPKIRRIFKSTDFAFYGDGAREYARVGGKYIEMKSPIIHHDRKPISAWIQKHNNNADREAAAYFKSTLYQIEGNNIERLSSRIKIKLWIRSHIWNRLPLFFRPLLYFIYRYFCKLGLLDGRAGLIYCFLHALWYQSLIDIKIIEIEGTSRK